ncbi:MAG: hypothetical protein M3P39_08120 [Actinomycetota bacterium]|nr:hypothetical protein [Actinomycetota bacterium]
MHGGRAGLEDRAEVHGGAQPLDHLVAPERHERLHAQALAGAHRAPPGAELGGRGRRPHPAAAPQVGLDALALADPRELVDGLLGGEPEAQRAGRPRPGDERLRLRPPAQREAPVAPGGASAADVGLEQRHVEPRTQLPQPQRGPQPV